MDIKDFILIAGGILIAMVIGHGFWIALRAKREPLRLDIVPDLIPGDIDEIERLRGELPNGGGRVVNARIRSRGEVPTQASLDLAGQAPMLMDPLGEVAIEQTAADDLDDPHIKTAAPKGKHRKAAREAAEREALERARRAAAQREASEQASRPATDQLEPHLGPVARQAPRSRAAETPSRPHIREVDLLTTTDERNGKPDDQADESVAETNATQEAPTKQAGTGVGATQEPAPVEELLVIHVLAPKGKVFAGEDLVGALRAQGLRYGDMSIFHRVDPATKAHLYSVANVLEPGTFDLSDLNHMRSPGMSFFLQLPGPDDASAAFADMLQATRNVAVALGGEQRDEQMSMLTGQATEHMRQRIADYTRRRLFKRA